MAVHLNMVSVDGGYGNSTSPKPVSVSNSGTSRPKTSTSSSISEPNYNQPVTSTRSSASSKSGSGSTGSSGSGSTGSADPINIPNTPHLINYSSTLYNGGSTPYAAALQNLANITGGCTPYAAALQNPANNFVPSRSSSSSSNNSSVKYNLNTYDVDLPSNAISSLQNFNNNNISSRSYANSPVLYNPVASGINTVLAFSEGVAKAFENFSDAAYTFESMNTAAIHYDMAIVASALGYDDLALRNNEFSNYYGDQKRIVEHISVNHTDKYFDSLYSTDGMQFVNNSAGGIFKRNNDGKSGFVYSFVKSVGEYSPAIIASASGGTALQAAVVATNSLGKNLDKNYVNVVNSDSRSFASALREANMKAAFSTAVDGGTVLAAGLVKDVVSSNYKDFLDINFESTEHFDPNLNKTIADELAGKVSIGVKSLKPLVNEVIDTYVYREDDEFDWGGVIVDGAAIVGSEIVASSIGNYFSNIKKFNNSSTKEVVSKTELVNSSTKTVFGDENVEISVKPEETDTEIMIKDIFINQLYNNKFNIYIANSKVATDIFKRMGKQATSDLESILIDLGDDAMDKLKELANNE